MHPDGIKRLAVALITWALRDAHGSNGPTQQMLAYRFFQEAAAGRPEALWFDIAGINPKVIIAKLDEQGRKRHDCNRRRVQ